MPTGAQIDQIAIARPRVVLGNQMDTHVGPATIVDQVVAQVPVPDADDLEPA